MKPRRRARFLILVTAAALPLLIILPFGKRAVIAALQRVRGRASIEQRIAEYSPTAESRLRNRFAAANTTYPPRSISLLGLKAERELRLFATVDDTTKLIAAYPIMAASGRAGPKLREGDQQVPEGFYRVEALNPNSLFHLAIRVDYPSVEDCAIASAEGRGHLGGDIMIHGSGGSVGCIALSNEAVEELFILVARAGIDHTEIILAPGLAPRSLIDANTPPWVAERYSKLQVRIDELRGAK